VADVQGVGRFAIRHWPCGVIIALAGALLLTNLGGDALWEDEGDTAVLARSILQTGLPKAWDGVAFLDPDYGQRLTSGLVMVSHPWLQYYVAAGSLAVFGESAAAARLPFAVAGLATIVTVYAFVITMLRSRRVAVVAALLLTVSVQFLLLARQARNYPLHALLTCLIIWRFLRLDSWRHAAMLAALGIVLFHVHPLGLATVAALGTATAFADFAQQRRWFWPAAAVVFAYAVPWMALSRAGHAEAMSPITGFADVGWRLAQFAIEYGSVTPLVALVGLAAVMSWRRGRIRIEPHERAVIVVCLTVIGAQAALATLTQTPTDLWILGVHHTPALIPLTILLVSWCIVKLAGGRSGFTVAAVLLLAFTRAGQVVPWVSWAEPVAQPNPVGATFHVPPRPLDRMLRTTQVQFVRSLLEPNPGTVSRVASFLRDRAAPGDVVLTNAESQALYFHTGLPLAAKVASTFSIYPVVRALSLPEYVFGYEGLRWIVWRRAFPAYFPEQDIAAVLERFATVGIRAELVASFPETIFENRENIHFRRYPGEVHVFPWHDEVPEARVYRVEWPQGPERWYVDANTAFAAQRFGDAIADYERFVNVRPDHAEALARLGVSYVLSNRAEAGIAALQQAISRDPQNGFAALALANALFDARRAADAEVHARRATALRPRDPLAWDALGRVAAVLGRPRDAIRHFEQALALDPAAAQVRQHLARVREAISR
jgi:tetratricopeptide (TPR) repeat protein